MLRARHNPLKPLLLAAVMLLAPGVAAAQSANPLCNTPPEVIVTPYPHSFGVPAVWDTAYAQPDSLIQFAAGVPLESGTVMAWGRALKPKTFEPVETLLVELNRRGRALTLKSFAAKAGENPVDLLRLADKGYVALSGVRAGRRNERQQARLSWYSAAAEYRSDKILSDGTFDYAPVGLVPVAGGDGFIVILHAVNNTNDKDQNGLLMRFSRDGSLLWRRAYRPGIPNQLRGVATLPDGNYLATGRILMDDGRMSGWALKLGPDGTIIWQRTYPRGAFSVLSAAATLPSVTAGAHDLLVLGDARPIDRNPDAAWLMAMDSTGEPLWQRYVRRPDYTLSALGLMVELDGRVTVGLNAAGIDGAGDGEPRRDHVRLFTLSAHGVLISDEAYIDGIEARGFDLFRGVNSERVIVGTVQSDARPLAPTDQLAEALKTDDAAPENAAPPPKPDEILQEGWIVVATALDPYDDPCLKPQPVPKAGFNE